MYPPSHDNTSSHITHLLTHHPLTTHPLTSHHITSPTLTPSPLSPPLSSSHHTLSHHTPLTSHHPPSLTTPTLSPLTLTSHHPHTLSHHITHPLSSHHLTYSGKRDVKTRVSAILAHYHERKAGYQLTDLEVRGRNAAIKAKVARLMTKEPDPTFQAFP